jgi:DNA-binding response OmpR family regulator
MSDPIRLLLVDDDADFRRATTTTLARRGFAVTEAESGEAALVALQTERPDVVVLDLKMPGMGGIEALRQIRETDAELPVIVLTGHGDFDAAFAGIALDIVDFLHKPMDVEELAERIRRLVHRGTVGEPLREKTIAELMVSPSLYPKVYIDQPAREVFATLTDLFFRTQGASVEAHGIRSALVYDRSERFLGLVRFQDLMQLIIPACLARSPYSSYFTGMFIAQSKVIGRMSLEEVFNRGVTIRVDAPLMEAVHLMSEHRLISIPVMDGDKLVGVLRDRAVVLEIARSMAAPA